MFNLFKSNESKFCLSSALFISLIPIVAFAIIFYVLWIFMSMTLSFFEANGYPQIAELQTAYFEFLTQDLFNVIPYVFIFIIALFFVGYYVAKLFLRPFSEVDRFIKDLESNSDSIFKSRFLFGLNPMTHFSHVFFRFVYDAKKLGKFEPIKLDDKINNVKEPQFDKILYSYCFVFTLVFTSLTSLIILMITNDIHDNMIQLAIRSLPTQKMAVTNFLSGQDAILISAQVICIIILLFLYNAFIYTRFKKVNGPAYAFFRSMRSFVQGTLSEVVLRNDDPVHKEAESFNQFIKKINQLKK
jgi:hypothetical protein